MGAARVAIRHGIRGYSSSIGTACAAGAQSIGEAVRLLRAGEADVVVCGVQRGAAVPDARRHLRQRPRAGPRLGATRPPRAGRSTARRNGLVLGEGAGVLVLERAEHADARGAAGYATSPAGAPPTTPTTRPPRARTARAPPPACAGRWPTAGLEPARHRLRQRARHQHEARRRRRGRWRSAAVFGADGPPVSSTKAVTGHMLGASGVVEAAVTRPGAAPRAAAADAQPGRPGPGLRPATTSASRPRPAPGTGTCCPTPSASAATTSASCSAAARHARLARARPGRRPRPDGNRRRTSKGSGNGHPRHRPCRDLRRRRAPGGVRSCVPRSASGSTGRAARRPGLTGQRSAAARPGRLRMLLTSGAERRPPGGAVRGPARRRRGGGRLRHRRRPVGVRRGGRGRRDGDRGAADLRPAADATVVTADGLRLRRRDAPPGRTARRPGEFLPGAIEMIAAPTPTGADLLRTHRPRRGLPAGRHAGRRPSRYYQRAFGFDDDLRGVHRGRRAGHVLAGGAEPRRAASRSR